MYFLFNGPGVYYNVHDIVACSENIMLRLQYCYHN